MKYFDSFKTKKYIRGRIAASIVIILILVTLSISNIPISTSYSYREMDDMSDYLYMAQGNRVEQSIHFKKPYVEKMGICIINKTQKTQGTLHIVLHEQGYDDVLAMKDINLEEDNDAEFIWFEVNQMIDIDKTYQLDIITDSVIGELRLLGRNQETVTEEIVESANEYGVPLNEYLAVNISYRTKLESNMLVCLWMLGITVIAYLLAWEYLTETQSRLRKSICLSGLAMIPALFYNYCMWGQEKFHMLLYMGLVVYYVLIFILCFGLFIRNKIKFVPFFFVLTLISGIVYSFVFMPMSTPDESTHFYEAYRLSNILMGQESTDEYGNVLVRECDLYDTDNLLDDNYIVDFWKQYNRHILKSEEQLTASNYSKYIFTSIFVYIPQAIGITVARLLHCNYFWLVYLGRFANLLAFAIVVTAAVHITPKAKWFVLALCNFPFLIQEVASYSYDTLIIAFSILFGCYTFKLANQEKPVLRRQLIALALLCLCMANFKPVYIPLVGLVWLIPNRKISYSNIKAIGIKAALIAISLGMVLFVFQHNSPLNMESLYRGYDEQITEETAEQQLADEEWINTQVGYMHYSSGITESATAYLMHNPFDIFQRSVYTIIESIDWFVLYIFGNYMGCFEIRIPVSVTILFMFYFWGCIRKENEKKYNRKTILVKSYILLINIACVFAIALVAYLQMTPLGEVRLIGIQGRYFYPLMITIIFAIYEDIQEKDRDHFAELAAISAVHIMTLLYAESIIWNR